MRPQTLTAIILALFSYHAVAADTPNGQWTNITDPLVATLNAEGKKPAWPGNSAGLTVDRTTGSLFVVVAGQGLFKSTDQGATFARCDGGKVSGRCETAYTIQVDPGSSRLACFMLDGKCGMSLDGGVTWSAMKDVGRNWDFAAVDWSIEKPQTIFALMHEAGGQLMLTTDAGQSWSKLEKDPKAFALGTVDSNTFLLSKGEGLLRSADQGKTWDKVSELTPITRVMQTLGGTHYFFAQAAEAAKAKNPKTYDSFLIVSKDGGKTWKQQGANVDAAWGPIFGKDEKHIITLGRKGIIAESTDAGQTWKDVTALPAVKDFASNMPGWFVNLAYDPKADIFYVSRMGHPAFKFQR